MWLKFWRKQITDPLAHSFSPIKWTVFSFLKFLLLLNYSCISFLHIEFFILIFYCYSITFVCLFSPSLHPTQAKHPSLPHLHPPPWFCPCVLYSTSCNPLSSLSPSHSAHLLLDCSFFWYIYWLCYYSCPISAPSLNSILPTPSLPHSPPYSSCPWVILISSLASTFPTLFLPSPCLFSTYHLCYLFSVPFPPLSPSRPPADNPPCDLHFCGSVSILVVCLVFFLF